MTNPPYSRDVPVVNALRARLAERQMERAPRLPLVTVKIAINRHAPMLFVRVRQRYIWAWWFVRVGVIWWEAGQDGR